MQVVITGGGGFLGRRLTGALLRRATLAGPDGRQQAIDRILVVDIAAPPATGDPRVVPVVGDAADATLLERVVQRETTAIFHLAAIVSGMAESDFDLGMRVNLDGTRLLLDACRAAGHKPRLVFTSSVAVYGGDLPVPVLESTALTPLSSYGTQKAIAELLINDYTRKGFVDGRSLRLPTISVRPGRPNAALSSFASGIIREPLNGETAVCPVDGQARLWLMSPQTVIECLIMGHEIAPDRLDWNRSFNLPGISLRVADMVAALERVAGRDVVDRILWQPDPLVQRMVANWPGECDAARARALGFPTDGDFDTVIRAHMSETQAAPAP